MWLGETGRVDVDVIPTGSLSLDIALGIGGIPRGRVVEVFGPEASGKTTLALHILAEAQKMGGKVAFIDAEHALDPTYAQAIGVNLNEMLISQPSSGEQALEITEQLVRSSALDIIVIDSVAALVPEAEILGEMGDAQVGLQARLMSKAMRKLTSIIGNTKTTVLFINQIRSNISTTAWGPKTTTTGGLALKFYASVRAEIRRIGSIEENKEKVGNETKIKVVKNKMAPPFREVVIDIIYGKGIERFRELIHLGENLKLIKRRGAWYSYEDENIGQGIVGAASYLEANSGVAKKLEAQIREHYEVPLETSLNESSEDVELEDFDDDIDGAPVSENGVSQKL